MITTFEKSTSLALSISTAVTFLTLLNKSIATSRLVYQLRIIQKTRQFVRSQQLVETAVRNEGLSKGVDRFNRIRWCILGNTQTFSDPINSLHYMGAW